MSDKGKSGTMAVVYVKDPGPEDENGIPVADLRTVERDGERVLSGRLFFGGDHWINGRTIIIVPDEVAYLVEFESPEEYEKVVSGFHAEQPPPGFGAARPKGGRTL